MKKLPIIALIGQTNAGKSSILNRMARKNIAIVAREEGTTRDNVVATIDDTFILIDTAGLKDPSDDFEASIQDQIQDAIETADVILVTLDSSKYPDDRDKMIAKKALKSRKPVFLVLNKSDLGDSLEESEFLRLGIKPDMTFRTSATTGQGILKLKEGVLSEPIFSEAGLEFSGTSYAGRPGEPSPTETNLSASSGIYVPKNSNHFMMPRETDSVTRAELPTISLNPNQLKNTWKVEKVGDVFVVTGEKIEKFARRTDLANYASVNRLRDILKKFGIRGELTSMGAQPDSIISIAGKEFTLVEDY